MKLSLRLFALLILLTSAVALPAQIVKDPTSWKYELKQIKGDQYKAIFHLTLQKGWHIWSINPGGDGLQIKPEFVFDKSSGVKTNGDLHEAGNKITGTMEGVDGPVSRFENKVDYTQNITVSKAGKISGTLSYQVCNDQMCLPPKKKAFSFDVKGDSAVAATDTSASHIDTAQLAAVATSSDSSAKASQPLVAQGAISDSVKLKTKAAKAEGTATLFILGLGAGLSSVITPCVFAMLPMTVSFFLKRSKDRKTGVKIALQYSLAIILIFTAIGALFAIFFTPDALHKFSTNWIVNLFFAIIFLAFGISFLGAFEINLPSSWATKMDTKANTRNFAGIFFMALTLVIVSFSCTVPFISSMITLMGKGGKFGPLIGFFGFGLGLALPFSLFAIFPSLINELGKQGGWLNVVKVTFGFVELGLALKFLSNADLQMHWRLLDREVFLAMWIGLSFILGMYLLGVFRFSHDSEMPKNDWGLPYLKVPRFLVATSAIIFALYLLPGMWGAPLNAMGAFLPPMGTQDFVLGGEGAAIPVTSTESSADVIPVKYVKEMKINEPPVVVKYKMTIFFDYAEALAASKKAHKPIMLDFTGINCANCRKMETGVWSDPEVMKRLKNDFILASLYCDANAVSLPKEEQYYAKSMEGNATTLGEKNQDIELTQFNSNTLPNYFFIDGDGNKLYEKGTGYPTSVPDFIKILESVKSKYKEMHP